MADTLNQINSNIVSSRIDKANIKIDRIKNEPQVIELLKEASIIEAYFALFVGKMLVLFHDNLDASASFCVEAYESYTHYLLLSEYLDYIGEPVNKDHILNLKKEKFDVIRDDKIREIVNFMGTEHFATFFFKDLSNLTEEPVIKKLLAELSKEEAIHSSLAFDVLKDACAEDPENKELILKYAKNFEHVGGYVLRNVTNVTSDNLKAIVLFNEKIKRLTGESLTEYYLENL